VGILSRYKPTEEQIPLSKNLNQILKRKYKKYKVLAKKKNVNLLLDLDPAGCPTMIVSESIERIIDSLIENALEVSGRNYTIMLSTKRGGSDCTLTISDEGPGVAKENLPKLFSPFFTTSPEGSGLSLSVGRKVLRELGGDLVYNPTPLGGASFSMVVPRENTQNNIGDYAMDKGLV
jgi:signal transduction histidine kinase